MVLTHPDPAATNSFDRPDVVKPVALKVSTSGNTATVLLPKQSVASLQIQC